MSRLIRRALPEDTARIAAIYNQGIAERQATFETRPREPAEILTWLRSRGPVVVAERDGTVIGFARVSPYSLRDVYAGVGEHGVYVDVSARGAGVGRALLDEIARASDAAGLYKLTCRIFTTNAASIAAHRAAGFEAVGVQRRHGRLEGRWRDALLMERLLGDAADGDPRPPGAPPAAADAVARRRYEREHRTAETLQRALLPETLPAVDGYELTARYRPGDERVEVGGDWYDAFPMPGGRLGIAVGDVVGRGLKAAAAMGQLRNALRACAYASTGPAAALDQLHTLLEGLGRPTFATVVHLVLDPGSGTLDVASAGHLPPLVLPAGGGEPVFAEPPRCPPLGAPWPKPAEQSRLVLAPGDTLLLYTDGLVEERERSLDDGLADLCAAAASAPDGLDALAGHIVARLTDGRGAGDDVALLALRRDIAMRG